MKSFRGRASRRERLRYQVVSKVCQKWSACDRNSGEVLRDDGPKVDLFPIRPSRSIMGDWIAQIGQITSSPLIFWLLARIIFVPNSGATRNQTRMMNIFKLRPTLPCYDVLKRQDLRRAILFMLIHY